MRVALLLFAALLLPTAGAAAAPRAVWVWEQDSRELLLSREAANSAAAFLRARGVTTLYLYADNFKGANLLESRPELYRALLRRLHRRGFRVYALLGSAYLHTEEYVLPGRRNDALAMLRCALAYNAASAPDQRFDGVNVDIEPYILPQWSTQRDRLLRLYLDLGRALMELKRSSTVSFPVGPAIPFWFDGITLDWNGSNKPVSGHVFDIYDYAAIMDYRDHAEGRDGLIALAAGELASASRDGRKAKQFHAALTKLYGIVKETIEALFAIDEAADIQFFCVIQIDGQIELTPGSGTYGTQLEQTGRVSFTGNPDDRMSISPG